MGQKIAFAIEAIAKVLFRIIGMIVRVAPIGAFGAMAFTIGSQGLAVEVGRKEVMSKSKKNVVASEVVSPVAR